MRAQEKLQAIYESRKETAGIYSEGLKKAYYAGKAAALEAAKLEYIKEKTSALTAAAIEGVNKVYKQASEDLEKARATYLTNDVLAAMKRSLTEEEQRIISLYAVFGYKHREIAKMLGVPTGTVTSKYKRAIDKLKNELKEDGI